MCARERGENLREKGKESVQERGGRARRERGEDEGEWRVCERERRECETETGKSQSERERENVCAEEGEECVREKG